MRIVFICHNRDYKVENIAEAIRCFTHAGFEEFSPGMASRNGDELNLTDSEKRERGNGPFF
jgi:hypothetical protein